MSGEKLYGLSEVFTYFRKNETPVYFVSPTSFNLLGLDQWVGSFEYISYFDSFDGYHPRVLLPTHAGPREFRSMEEVGNDLLEHKEVVDHIRQRGGGKLLLVMFDEETEAIANDLGVEIALGGDVHLNTGDGKRRHVIIPCSGLWPQRSFGAPHKIATIVPIGPMPVKRTPPPT